MDGYWTDVLQRRVSRRRGMAASGGAAAAALLLAACGGSDDGGEKTDANSLIAQYVDSTKKAVPGGTAVLRGSRESLTVDPQVGTAADLVYGAHAYQRLLQGKVGTVFSPPDGTIEGQAATSWEVSPDRLQVTLKLRPNNKFDPRTPTNSRVINSADVKFSFDRFAALSPNRGNVLNSLNKDLPVVGLDTPDSNTVVVKLAHPDASIMSMLAWGWFLNIMPVEADGKFDPRTEMRGSGPWMMTDLQRSLGWSYKKNPNWYRAGEGLPFLDGLEYPLIPETTVVEAQFRAKRLWSYTPSAEHVLQLKRDNPTAQMYQESPKQGNGSMRVMVPSKIPGNPLMDVRILQAMSMLIDRDLTIDVFGNVSDFAKEGVPLETAWHTHVPASWSAIWEDPQSSKAPESKYFQHNPDEAAKLLRAAGRFGFQTKYAFWTPADASWTRQVEVVKGMLEEGGHFKLNYEVTDYMADYQPKYNRTDNQYEGIAAYQIYSGMPDFNMVMWNHTNPGARNSYIHDFNEVPGVRDVMVKAREELDEKKRNDLYRQWQKLLAQYMPFIPHPWPSGAGTFSFAWPWYGNFNVHRAIRTSTEPTDTLVYGWYDKTQDQRS
jgi:peptide/nickel transport system substrate-binding protein